MITKRCRKFGKSKLVIAYAENSNSKDGLQAWCKECFKDYCRQYSEKAKLRSKKQYELRKNDVKFQNENRRRANGWQKNHSVQMRLYRENWVKKNHKHMRSLQAQWLRDKRNGDPKYRLNNAMSSAIRRSLRHGKTSVRWERLVCYTFEALKSNFAALMSDKNARHPSKTPMLFSNYGEVWEVHHKIPISYWEFEEPDDREFRQCWAMTNLEPLWKKDNRSKGNKI